MPEAQVAGSCRLMSIADTLIAHGNYVLRTSSTSSRTSYAGMAEGLKICVASCNDNFVWIKGFE